MGMGDNAEVDIAGGKVQRVVVVLVPPLLQAAVNQNFLAVYLQAVAAAGYGVGRTEKRQFHAGSSFIR